MGTPSPKAGSEGPRTPLRGIRVLVVDDNADVRDLIAAVLERAAADVSTADSAEQALEAIKAQRPDVLLCDLHMPGIDGFELIHRLRAWERDGGHARADPRRRRIRLRVSRAATAARPR